VLACVPPILLFPAVSATRNSNIQQTQSSSASTRIAGIIVNAISGIPLARARVAIQDAKDPRNVQSQITSDDGRFAFTVSPGKYALEGAKRGYITSSFNQHEEYSTAIVTGAGFDTENLVFRLAPSAVISGRILDESGEPVRQATISLYREDRRAGVGRILRAAAVTTDDQGVYEFTSLNAGTYFLSVTAMPWYAQHPVSTRQPDAELLPAAVDSSLDVAYPVTYYGDSTEPDDATPIPVRGGDHLQADIHLTPVPALHLIFHTSENSPGGVEFPVLQKPSFDGAEIAENSGIQQVAPGLYEMTGVAPGRYTIRKRGAVQEDQANEVEISQNGQELNVSATDAYSSVKATVQIAGEATLPKNLSVALRNSKMRVVAWQNVNAKGEIEFQDVAPGKYEVLSETPSKAYSVARISSPAEETPGHILNVAAGASLNLSLSLVGAAVNVEGFAKRAGKGTAGAMVVLVPRDPELHRDLFRRDQSDQDGSFSLRSVIPGSYTIVAIEDGWDLDWSRPGVIAHYAKRGQAVTVTNSAQTSLHLSDAVEVQPR
jgi:protocatechuate 3,4-dioxygenase beta subunit